MEAIERLHPDRHAEQLDRLAHHAFRGELWEKAVRYLHRAGVKAATRSAYREAVHFFGEAVSACPRLPDTRQARELAIDLRLDLRSSLQPLAELEPILGHLRDAEELAKALDDRQRLAWVSVYLSHHFRMAGDLRAARRFAETAHAIAASEAPENPSLEVVANYYLGIAYLALGDPRRGEDYLRRSLHPLDRGLVCETGRMSGSPAVMSRYHLTWSLGEQGRFEEGIACGEHALSLAEGFDHPFSVSAACLGLGRLYDVRGGFSAAQRLLERGRATSREWNLALFSPILAAQLGHVYAQSGRVSDGLSLLREALTTHESLGLGVFHSLAVVHFGEACVLGDQPEEAFTSAMRALAMARERGERGYEAYALHLLAEVASHPERSDLEAAETHYRDAWALANELGMRPLVAHCYLGLGKLSAARASASVSTSTSPRRGRCTARWTWASGWRRRRRRWACRRTAHEERQRITLAPRVAIAARRDAERMMQNG